MFSVEITRVFVYYPYMSLFQFGCSLRREEPSPEDSVEVEMLESHIPMQEDTNLGVVEHRETGGSCKPFKTRRDFATKSVS